MPSEALERLLATRPLDALANDCYRNLMQLTLELMRDVSNSDLVSVGAAGGVAARRCREIIQLVREVLAKMP